MRKGKRLKEKRMDMKRGNVTEELKIVRLL